MDGSQTVPFGKHSHAFQDLFGAMVQSIKCCPLILNKKGSADFALQALSAFARPAVSNDVSVIDGCSFFTGQRSQVLKKIRGSRLRRIRGKRACRQKDAKGGEIKKAPSTGSKKCIRNN